MSTPIVNVLSLHTSPLAQPGAGDAGGMNVFVLQSALALAATGSRVNIFTRSRAAWTRSPAPGVYVYGVPAGGDRHLSKEQLAEAVPDFAAALLSHADFDARAPLHSHYWLSGAAAALVRRRHPGPWVHTMHTTAARKHRHSPGVPLEQPRASAEASIAATADALTANTPSDREELLSDFGLPPHRVSVVSPGIDTAVFTPEGERAAWPLSCQGPRLLFAGRIQPYKGPQIAISALGLLARHGIGGTLVLLGDRSGAGAQDPAALAAAAGVGARVLSLPPVPHTELAAWYRSADAVLMPSRHETYGLVAAEALACGTPVFAHAVGGLRTLVNDGVDGRLLPDLDPVHWAEALARLQHGAPLAWRSAAAETGAHRGWDATARTLQALYARLEQPRAA
ncbi:glycosyltransferase [Galactobacter valiniphilus]|uniref:glycosyltransferase n=1 Tax=Galactobacter valiniphilus TaxID=2676122 RepID=UPI0037364B4D